ELGGRQPCNGNQSLRSFSTHDARKQTISDVKYLRRAGNLAEQRLDARVRAAALRNKHLLHLQMALNSFVNQFAPLDANSALSIGPAISQRGTQLFQPGI